MQKLRIECDYADGAIPEIIDALVKTNGDFHPGYAADSHCEHASELIREKIGDPDACVQFLSGGTQTNALLISVALRPWQGALCADTGHISEHETGAVEATGHKVLPLPSEDGKINAEQVREYCRAHWANSDHEHIVMPGMVYISEPTETGSIYTKAELQALLDVCKEYDLYLYGDGARLAYALPAEDFDMTLPEFASFFDAFYIGGTKCGALFGEALVLRTPELAENIRYAVKRAGAMLAKGRLLGIQFEELMTGDRYYKIGENALRQAQTIKEACARLGYPEAHHSTTNQIFVTIPNHVLDRLEQNVSFSRWEEGPDTTVARFCPGASASDEMTRQFVEELEKASRTE